MPRLCFSRQSRLTSFAQRLAARTRIRAVLGKKTRIATGRFSRETRKVFFSAVKTPSSDVQFRYTCSKMLYQNETGELGVVQAVTPSSPCLWKLTSTLGGPLLVPASPPLRFSLVLVSFNPQGTLALKPSPVRSLRINLFRLPAPVDSKRLFSDPPWRPAVQAARVVGVAALPAVAEATRY